MAKKRKNNPGGALWLILGLAAGGGLVWAYSQDVFDKKKPSKKKKNGKKTLPPPEEKDEDFDNGFLLNEDCTRIEDFDVAVFEDALTNFIADVLEAEDIETPEQLAAAEDPVDFIGVLSLVYLRDGDGTNQCSGWELHESELLDGLTRFEALLFINVFAAATALMADAGVLSDEQAFEVMPLVLSLAEKFNLNREYAESVGFPAEATDAIDQGMLDAVDPDAPKNTTFRDQ